VQRSRKAIVAANCWLGANKEKVLVDLKGIFPAVTTPFASDGAFSPAKLRENIGRYNQCGLAGYVLTGSTGEAVLLRWDEAEQVWQAAKEAAEPGKILIAGTAAESTAETIEHTNRAAALGIDAALVRTPHYFKPQMTPDVLAEYYLRVAHASRIPILLYSVPIFTQLKLPVSVIERVSTHPNIIGMKDSSGDLQGVAEILSVVPKSFQLLVGAVSVMHESLERGAKGAILAVACAFPEICVEAYQASRSGDSARAKSLQAQLISAANLFGPKHGIAGIKYAMDCAGFYGGLARPPLLPLGPEAKREIDAMLADVVPETIGRR
jgi:4-hydroxy-2-oxoglutarate aldolase